jgi:hypothetical protein
MVEKIPNPEHNVVNIEVVEASRDQKVKNCIAIKAGKVPTILEIVRAADENEAIIKNNPDHYDQYLVQFPGEGQELMTYGEIYKKLENLPKQKSLKSQ